MSDISELSGTDRVLAVGLIGGDQSADGCCPRELLRACFVGELTPEQLQVALVTRSSSSSSNTEPAWSPAFSNGIDDAHGSSDEGDDR